MKILAKIVQVKQLLRILQSTSHYRNILSSLKYFLHSESQLLQDLVVCNIFNFKRGGFFVEFGAADGRFLSNTFLLEKSFGWSGILAEPARSWHDDLFHNRTCSITTKCISDVTGRLLPFNECAKGEYSSLFTEDRNPSYMVETISLNDLLRQVNAPEVIDYLSIDTEGGEFAILRSIDFSRYIFKFITCEHNYSEERDHMRRFLAEHGFRPCFTNMSFFDDWYIHESVCL